MAQAQITVGIRDAEIARVMKLVKKRFAKAETNINMVIAKYALKIQYRIKDLMRKTPQTGRRYKRGKKGVHIASSPGQAPAVDFGALWNAVEVELSKLAASVWTGIEYAPHLEYGTVHMAARPSFRVAFEEYREEILREMRKALQDAVEK